VSGSDRQLTAADYVLGGLDDLERVRFEKAMQADVALRREVDALEGVAGTLGSMSSAAWRHGAGGEAPARRRRRIRLPALAGAAGLAAAACLALILLLSGSSGQPRAVHLTALAGAPASARAVAYIHAGNRAEMIIEGLHPTDRAHYYELWLMSSTTRLVPVAAFRVDAQGRARMSLPLPAPAARYRYLDVSIQRQGGPSSISQYSVLRGETRGA